MDFQPGRCTIQQTLSKFGRGTHGARGRLRLSAFVSGRLAVLVLLLVCGTETGIGLTVKAGTQPAKRPATPGTTPVKPDPVKPNPVTPEPVIPAPEPVKPSPVTAEPVTPDPVKPNAAPQTLPDTAVFLLGSGLALLIALLAWGEQIRAITRDTRDLERDFLDATDLTRSQLSALLQAKNDDDRLVAFTQLMASGKLTSASQVEILPLFEKWRRFGAELRRLQSTKYWLTVALTVTFLATGTLVAFGPADTLSISQVLALPAFLVLVILLTIISAGRVEQRLNALLMQMSEKV